MGTRKRDVVFRPRTTHYHVGLSPTNRVAVNVSIVGGQITTDQKSLWPISRGLIRQAERRKSTDRGSKLAIERIKTRDYGTTGFSTQTNTYKEVGRDADYFVWLNTNKTQCVSYKGPIFSVASNVSNTSQYWPVMQAADRQRLYALGSTAISRVIPTNPASGLGVALGELKEGIPSLVGSQLLHGRARDFHRNVGSEYLNVEFGWKPLIQDITSVAKSVRDSEKILAQYERDSGKFIRRRFRFPDEVTTETSIVSTNAATSPPLSIYHFLGPSTGTLERTRSTTTSSWFSGCFSYFLSAGDTPRAKLKKAEQEAAKLLGLRLTPDLLYQLAPWSWLIDWNSNMGDVIRNISAFANDGLVMRWGYIMSTRTVTDTYSLRGVQTYGGTRPYTQSFSTTQKVRYKATPYGFGLDTGAFTTRQWAILAALGISRGPRQL